MKMRMRLSGRTAVLPALPLLAAALLHSQTPDIQFTQIASGLSGITDIENAGDGSNRLFFTRQSGTIRVWKNGALLAAPFLDLTAKTRSTSECGLLGLAFPPGYPAKGYFYVVYTDNNCQNSILARYRTSANPDVADPNSETVILTQPQPFSNHNGGQIRFGPDGFLYLGFGDGGDANDPMGNGQNRHTWLGSMLRIDVESGAAPYAVPPGNPFVNNPASRPEIWAWGLRNPWRFSFDRATGDLWIGDVGQNRAEEIDFEAAGDPGGHNYGWNLMEGLQCRVAGCDKTGLTLPILEYATRAQGDQAITGGFVYRGARSPSLRGLYLYGDYVSGRVWALRREGGQVVNLLLRDTAFNISTFGEDEAGEIYVGDIAGGGVYRIDGPASPGFTAESVVNAASYEAGLAPGALATIFVSGVLNSPGTIAATALPLPMTLAGVSVTIGGRAAPLLAIANVNGAEQINLQVPFETFGSAAEVIVTRDGLASQPVTVPVLAQQPAIFAGAGGEAVLVHSNDNSLVTAGSPVLPGEYVYFYANALGPVSNTPPTGSGGPTDPLAHAISSIEVTLAGTPCEVLYAGLAPNLAGVFQINIRIPTTLQPGSGDLVIRSGILSSEPAKVPIGTSVAGLGGR